MSDKQTVACKDGLQVREWVGLTNDEITELFCDYDASQFLKFVRAIEAKLKQKNTMTPEVTPEVNPRTRWNLCGND